MVYVSYSLHELKIHTGVGLQNSSDVFVGAALGNAVGERELGLKTGQPIIYRYLIVIDSVET